MVYDLLSRFGDMQLRHGGFPRDAICNAIPGPGRAVYQQGAGIDGQGHIGELVPGHLHFGQRPAEKLPRQGVPEGFFQRAPGKTQCRGAYR